MNNPETSQAGRVFRSAGEDGDSPTFSGRDFPDRAPASVIRPRLYGLIESPVLAPVTLIIAPAGFGKSTLAGQWAKHAPHRVAWLSLGVESNNLELFLREFVRVLATAIADSDVIAAGPPTVETVISLLAAAIARHDTGDIAVVI
ncbi:MAG: hypothetical protein ACRDHN_09270, partial [Thermomicrobiales bacterium]